MFNRSENFTDTLNVQMIQSTRLTPYGKFVQDVLNKQYVESVETKSVKIAKIANNKLCFLQLLDNNSLQFVCDINKGTIFTVTKTVDKNNNTIFNFNNFNNKNCYLTYSPYGINRGFAVYNLVLECDPTKLKYKDMVIMNKNKIKPKLRKNCYLKEDKLKPVFHCYSTSPTNSVVGDKFYFVNV